VGLRGLKAGKDPLRKSERQLSSVDHREGNVLAIAGTGYGLIGLLIIILLVVLIVYYARRA
jgi:hypothetical protein